MTSVYFVGVSLNNFLKSKDLISDKNNGCFPLAE